MPSARPEARATATNSAERPIELSRARILVTNDDGINARGLKLLTRIARSLSRDVWVVCPGLSH
jgi:hypothetical protein